MSGFADDDTSLKAMLARIDRDLAESAKLRQETQKYVAEHDKLFAETAKLFAEQRKLDRDRWLAPLLAVAAVIGGLLGVASFIAKVAFGT